MACVLSHVRLFVTLWTVAHQAPLSMEFPRQEYWHLLPFSSPGELPDPAFLALAGRFFTTLPWNGVGRVIECGCKKMFHFLSIYIFICYVNHNKIWIISELSAEGVNKMSSSTTKSHTFESHPPFMPVFIREWFYTIMLISAMSHVFFDFKCVS